MPLGTSPFRTPLRTISTLAGILLLVFSLTLEQPTWGQTLSDSDIRARSAERFSETTFPLLADSYDVPGAVFAVVGKAGTLALKGYGCADIDSRQPADPERTLFRIGSVSKPVTATTVLQLWQCGTFELRADVNNYLDRMDVPEAFEAPVTLHELLTHTAGFDEQLFCSGAPEALDLGKYLRTTLSERASPPGLLHSHSNQGYGLLGVLVADLTGSPFAEVADHLTLAPLGMLASTFHQPPPPQLRERVATGYECSGEECTPLPYDFISFAPAGALQTTAADMARFIALHLNGTGGVLAAGHLVFTLGLAAAFLVLGPEEIYHPLPFWVRALFAVPTTGAALGLFTLPAAVRVWRRNFGSIWTRLHYTVVVVAAVTIIQPLAYWNRLSLQF